MDSYRILLFISSLRGGGAENHLINLCRYLKASSHLPAVCTLSPAEERLEDVLRTNDVACFRFPLTSLKELAIPKNLLALRRIVKLFHPDVIHAHLFHAEVVSVCASLFARVPVIATRHSAGLEFLGRRRWLMKIIQPRFDFIIAVSTEAATEALDMSFPAGQVKTLPNAVDTERFRPIDGSVHEERRRSFLQKHFPGPVPFSCVLIGTVGGLKPVKNFTLFIRMAARLIEQRSNIGAGPALRFAVVGEGSEREKLFDLARVCGIDSCIAFPGYCERPEEVYNLFDIFILPSMREGVPMVLLEAMSSGVPCIASDVGGVGEVAGDAVVLVESGDVNGFVEAIGSLVDNEDRRRELGRETRAHVRAHFDLDLWGRKLLQIYRLLVKERNG